LIGDAVVAIDRVEPGIVEFVQNCTGVRQARVP
jgi:hypothetical protein